MTRKCNVWSDEDTDYLRQNYPAVRTRILSIHLGRNHEQIWAKANYMGLKKKGNNLPLRTRKTHNQTILS